MLKFKQKEILSKSASSNIFEKINSIYESFKEPIAYILLTSAVILQYVEIEWIQTGVTISLGFLILQVLLNIGKEVAKKHTAELPKWHSWEKVDTEIIKSINKIADVEEKLHIIVLGISLRRAWFMIQQFIEKNCIAKNMYHLSSIDIELGIVDCGWLEERKDFYDFDSYMFNKYHRHGVNTESNLEEFKSEFNEILKRKKININIYKYKHMPNIYGFLINERELYRGICHWEWYGKGPNLVASGGEYELYRQGDTFGGSEKINEFKSWFKYCKYYENNHKNTESLIT